MLGVMGVEGGEGMGTPYFQLSFAVELKTVVKIAYFFKKKKKKQSKFNWRGVGQAGRVRARKRKLMQGWGSDEENTEVSFKKCIKTRYQLPQYFCAIP